MSYTIERKLSAEEIKAVVSAFRDKEGLEILKAIRDNAVSESDLPEQKRGKKSEEQQEEEQQTRAFIGLAKEEDVIGDDGDNEAKKGRLERLEGLGLILKGGYIPKDKERINGYKLTEEGYTLLNGVEGEEKEGSGNKRLSNSALIPDDSKKKQDVGAFKSEYNKEFKERNSY